MAQLNTPPYNPAKFIVDYYFTYVYKRNELFTLYENSATIYRQSWKTNISMPIQECTEKIYFSNENDHITVLNYATLPQPFGTLFVINGSIDSPDGGQVFFNHILQTRNFGYYQLIVADYFAHTSKPLWTLPSSQYYDVSPPNSQSNETPNNSEIPKVDDKINNQNEQPKQQVSQLQQTPNQQQQQAQLPTQQQQQQDFPTNNGGRGRDNNNYNRYYNNNNQRGRGRNPNRNDNRSNDLSEKYGSSNKFTYQSPKYIPPTQKP